jgi:hypothetical protein
MEKGIDLSIRAPRLLRASLSFIRKRFQRFRDSLCHLSVSGPVRLRGGKRTRVLPFRSTYSAQHPVQHPAILSYSLPEESP